MSNTAQHQIVSWKINAPQLLIFSDSLFIILRKREKQLSFLHVYHHATMWVSFPLSNARGGSYYIRQKTPRKKEIFTQVSAVVDRRKICGGRLQLSGQPTSLIIDHQLLKLEYNLTWSGCLLQLLCPCDHVLLLCSFHSGGERQVMSFGWRSWRMVAWTTSMGGKCNLNKSDPGRTCGGRSIWQYYRCSFVTKLLKPCYNILSIDIAHKYILPIMNQPPSF